MCGEVNSRNHQAYSKDHLVPNNTVTYQFYSVRLCQFSYYLYSSFLKLGKFDKEGIIIGTNFISLNLGKQLSSFTDYFGNDARDHYCLFLCYSQEFDCL